MSTKCYSVRLKDFVRISEKCYKAVAYDGSEALIPASQYYGQDFEVSKSDSFWISAWILDKKDLQYSTKKSALFGDDRQMLPSTRVTEHVPEKIEPKADNIVDDLKR